MLKRLLTAILLALSALANAQGVYVHVSNTDLYTYIDELANAGISELNSAVKPYSRTFIASVLSEADRRRSELNARQQQELDFYLRDFRKELQAYRNPNETRNGHDREMNLAGKRMGNYQGRETRLDLFYYQDSLFTFTVNPILGGELFSNDSGSFRKIWNGGEAWGYIGPHTGFYFSLRDNRESRRLSDPLYLNQYPASNYKPDSDGGGDFDEVRGGFMMSWKWGSVGLLKDNPVWGDNYHGANILSDHVPSYAHIRLHMKPTRWFDFNYLHGWLVSDAIDSARIYPQGISNRIVYRQKFVAANLFTFSPWKRFNFSFGNSIVYGDQPVHPVMLIPFLFYKSVDHWLTSTGSNFLGQNSQLFFNISSRNIRNLHLYSSLFIDELSLSNALDEDKSSNIFSAKIGARMSNFLVKNLFLTGEYTRSNPITYRHYIPTASFSSNSFNMGHYLGDNAQEIYLAAAYKPVARLWVEVSWSIAQKGQEYPYDGRSSGFNGKGLPFIDRVFWQAEEIGLQARYQVINDGWVFARFLSSDHHGAMVDTYTMPWFRGELSTLSFGANFGF